MESQPNNRIFFVSEDTIQNIRKIHVLDKPGRIEEAVNILEEWIQKQDHIIKKDFSKNYLEKTLISTKGSVEKAKKQIDRICTMRALLPKFFTNYNIKLEMQDVLDLFKITILPKLTKDYYRVVITEVKPGNITSEILLRYYQFGVMLAEYIKKHDYANGFLLIDDYREVNMFDAMTKLNTVELQQFVSILILGEYFKKHNYANGFIMINDFRQLNVLDLITKLNTVELQQHVSIQVEGYGARMKSIHIITESKAIELFIKTIKQFVSEKIGNRMHVHHDVKDMSQIVDKDILPKDYGGNERCTQELHKEFVEDISSEEFIQYMKMMNQACTDESRRNAAKFNEEYLGMPGSFRNLSVD